MNKHFKYIIFGILSLFICSCEFINGEYSLGHHLWLWDNDHENNAIIVYCEGNCNAGIYVVPSYKKHYDSLGHYAEYVKEAVANKKWVVAKTHQIKEKQDNYYIIRKDFNITSIDCSKSNCDSILQNYVIGPLNLNEFEYKKQMMNIDLSLK